MRVASVITSARYSINLSVSCSTDALINVASMIRNMMVLSLDELLILQLSSDCSVSHGQVTKSVHLLAKTNIIQSAFQ